MYVTDFFFGIISFLSQHSVLVLGPLHTIAIYTLESISWNIYVGICQLKSSVWNKLHTVHLNLLLGLRKTNTTQSPDFENLGCFALPTPHKRFDLRVRCVVEFKFLFASVAWTCSICSNSTHKLARGISAAAKKTYHHFIIHADFRWFWKLSLLTGNTGF